LIKVSLPEIKPVEHIRSPKERWLDSVREDLKIMGVLDWKKSVLHRKKWQELLEQTKTHAGL
jgi:hypothetical protein